MLEIDISKHGPLSEDERLSIRCELEEGERVAICMDPGVFKVAVFRGEEKVCGNGKMAFSGDSGIVQIGRGIDKDTGAAVGYYIADPLLAAKLLKHLLIQKYSEKSYSHGYCPITPYDSEKNAMVWFGRRFGVKSLRELFVFNLFGPENWKRI